MSRRRYEWETCDDCGAAVYKRRKYGVPIRCVECTIAKIAQSNREMMQKSGPAWEAWLASNADGAATRARPE